MNESFGIRCETGHNISSSERAFNPEAPEGHECFDKNGQQEVEVPLPRSLSEGRSETHPHAMGVGEWVCDNGDMHKDMLFTSVDLYTAFAQGGTLGIISPNARQCSSKQVQPPP